MRIHCTVRRSATRIHCTVRAIKSQCAARTVNIHVWSDSIASSVCHLFAWKKCVVSINVPPPQLWGGQHTEMFVDHVTVFSQSVSHIRLSHTILPNVNFIWVGMWEMPFISTPLINPYTAECCMICRMMMETPKHTESLIEGNVVGQLKACEVSGILKVLIRPIGNSSGVQKQKHQLVDPWVQKGHMNPNPTLATGLRPYIV